MKPGRACYEGEEGQARYSYYEVEDILVRSSNFRKRLGDVAHRLPVPYDTISDPSAELWWDAVWGLEQQLLLLANSSGRLRIVDGELLDRVDYLRASGKGLNVPNIDELLTEVVDVLRQGRC